MAPEDMVQLAVHRFDRDYQARWPLGLPTIQLVVVVDYMAVAVTIAGFVVEAADMHSARRRCNFDLAVEYYCEKRDGNQD